MASGSGSVYQRASDGRWVAALSVGKRRLTKYADTERKARQLLREMIGREERGSLATPTKTTVREWTERWLKLIVTDRRPATVATYSFALAPLLAVLGDTRLDRLTPDMLASALAALRHDGYGKSRINQTYRVLHVCLAQAVKLGVISINPAERVDPPRYAVEERPMWTIEEAQRFIDVCRERGGQYGPLFLFMLGTGVRRGECCAITWDDVDLSKRTVTIDKGLAFVRNKPVLQGTKTKASRRVVTLTDLAVEALTMLPRAADTTARVFLSGAETAPTPPNVRSALHRLCVKAGVPKIPPHGLRHTHISLLLAAGTDVLSVSRRVGHSRASITLDVYGHALRPDTHAALAFDRVVTEGTERGQQTA